MLRRSTQIPVGVILLLLMQLVVPALTGSPVSAQSSGSWFVYHQITNLPEATGGLGYPVLSGDGTTAVFSEAPGTGDPATPNRIFTIGSDGSGMTEIDSYPSLCYCGSQVDISNDGGTVVSTDNVQVRIVDGGGARSLVTLAGGEISSLVIAGDGQTVFFHVRRDTATSDGSLTIPRGVWAIDASGANLRQVVDADGVAALFGIPLDPNACCFHGDGHPLDVADDGSRLVFVSYGADGEHVISANGDGSNLVDLRGGLSYAMRVAISGDGALVAYDVTPAGVDQNEVTVTPFGDVSPHVLVAAMPYSGYLEPFQLTQTGSKLLVSSNGLLFDTASGDAELLGASISGVGGNHEAVLTDGLPRGTMDDAGEQFLYVMRTVRCADCANQQEQLATMTIDPVDLGSAPVISNGSIAPASILPEYGSEAVISASVSTDGQVLGVGFSALLGSEVDANLSTAVVLLDDGTHGDAVAGDQTYTAGGIVHAPVVVRDQDIGPRIVRVAAEVEDGNGLRHATAVDIGTLTVDETAAASR
jgi:hypothetical protein